MFKKTITYHDYNDQERTETCYFNLNKAELIEMEMTTSGGYTEMLNTIIKAGDVPTLFRTFKDFIFKAYGEKSADGKRFLKKDEITGRPLVEAFAETEAYAILLEELVTDAKAATEFINGIIAGKTSSTKPGATPAQAAN